MIPPTGGSRIKMLKKLPFMTKKVSFNKDFFQVGQVIEEGKVGWLNVDVRSALNGQNTQELDEDENNRQNVEDERPNNRALSSLIVRYQIIDDKQEDEDSNAAQLGVDFTAPEALLTTKSSKRHKIIVVPLQDGKGRLYISALKDAISEEDENISLRLIPDRIRATDQETGAIKTFKFYSTASEEIKLKIRDDNSFSPGIFITPKDAPNPRPLHIKKDDKEAYFDLHLTSKPENKVEVKQVTGINGSLYRLGIERTGKNKGFEIIGKNESISIEPENWNKALRFFVKPGQIDEESIKLELITKSLDKNYNNKVLRQDIVVSEDGFGRLSGKTQTLVIREDSIHAVIAKKPNLSVEVIGGSEGVQGPKVIITSENSVTQNTTVYVDIARYINNEQRRFRRYEAIIKEGDSQAIIYPKVRFDDQVVRDVRMEAKIIPQKNYNIDVRTSSDIFLEDDEAGISINSVVKRSEVILVEELVPEPEKEGNNNTLLAKLTYFGVHNYDNYDYQAKYGTPSDQTFKLNKGYTLESKINGEKVHLTLKDDAVIHHFKKEQDERDNLFPVTVDNLEAVYGSNQTEEIKKRRNNNNNLLSGAVTATAEYRETSARLDNLIPIDTYTAKEGRREIQIKLNSRPKADVTIQVPNRLQSAEAVLLIDDIENKDSTDRKGVEPSNQVELIFTPENWRQAQSIYVGQELFDLNRYYEGNWNIPVISNSDDSKYNKKETIRANSVFTPEDKVLDWSDGAK